MSYTVQFSPTARDQLAELEDHLSETASPAVAARYVDAIIAYCEGLAAFPMRSRGHDDLLGGLRITNYRRCAVIAFLVDAEAQIVSIVGIYYGGRDYEAILRGAPKMIARRTSKTARTNFVQAFTINRLRTGMLWLSYAIAMPKLHSPPDLLQ